MNTQDTKRLKPSNTKFSVVSMIAVACAILSFLSGAILGLILAVLAMVFGILGIVIAVSPRRRGGIGSALAIIGGVFGVVAAVIKAFLWFF